MNPQRVCARVLLAVLLCALALPSANAQNCRWDGTAPLCNGSCGPNETELTRLGSIPDFWVPPFVYVNPPFGSNCTTGTKALCCASPGRSCRWDGTAPFCAGSCRSDEKQTQPPPGSSSGAGCWTGSKVYCCKTSVNANPGSVSEPLTGARDCTYGPDTCIKGFVWRQAVPNDHVCVTPQVRQQAQGDNAQAAARRNPGGGAFGPDTCRSGFVWRDAFANDHVCVTPQARSQAAQDNHWAKIRDACP